MSDLGNAAISDSGDGAMLASIVENWPVDLRQAGDAIRQYRTMTFFAIALEGVTGLIILALAIITFTLFNAAIKAAPAVDHRHPLRAWHFNLSAVRDRALRSGLMLPTRPRRLVAA